MDIIFDIDGTIADCSARLHFLDKKPKDWTSFYQNVRQDEPFPVMITLLQTLFRANNVIILCTGRPEHVREDTLWWLHHYQVPFHTMFMRDNRDDRPDDKIKTMALEKMYARGFRPQLVFEDRDSCVQMWRAKGLQCCQVREGNY